MRPPMTLKPVKDEDDPAEVEASELNGVRLEEACAFVVRVGEVGCRWWCRCRGGESVRAMTSAVAASASRVGEWIGRAQVGG